MKAKTKKRFILCLLLAGTVLACAAQERVQLKIASLAPARSPWDIQLKELAQEWYEITDSAACCKNSIRRGPAKNRRWTERC